MAAERLRVGVYYLRGRPQFRGERTHSFRFYLGREFEKERDGHTLAKVRLLPRRFHEAVAALPRGARVRRLGEILYGQQGELARSLSYDPKAGMGERTAPGLGYYLEAVALNFLRRRGVRTMETSVAPSKGRRAQLLKAGLPVRQEVDVREWLRGMGRGIRRRRA
jgi:hypothetical protein